MYYRSLFCTTVTGSTSYRAAIFSAVAIAALFFISPKYCSAAVAQKIYDTPPRWEPLHPVVPPGEHVQRRIAGLIGAAGPVTVDIVQGSQESYYDQHPVPAQVCIAGAGAKSCYVPRMYFPRICDDLYYIIIKADTVEISPGQRALLVQTARAFSDETYMLTSLLVIGHKGKLINIFPELSLSVLQDEIMVWRDADVSPYLLVTNASFEFRDTDTSFFDRHIYSIHAYQFCPEVGRYTEALWFRLAKKNPGADARHAENMLLKKLVPSVKRRLLQRNKPCTAEPDINRH